MLTTLHKCKNYLNIADTDKSSDGFLIDLIMSAQSMIETYCGRKFDLQQYVEEQHIIGHTITPNNYPIQTVVSIKKSGEDVSNYRKFPSYIQMLDNKYVTLTNRLQWTDNEDSYVEVTYTAGYDDDDVPADLQLACTKLVAIEYKNSKEDRLGIQTDSVGPLSTSYDIQEAGIPSYIATTLNRYKKVHI